MRLINAESPQNRMYVSDLVIMECFHPSQEDVNRMSDEVRNIRESVNSKNLNIWMVRDAIKDEFGWEI